MPIRESLARLLLGGKASIVALAAAEIPDRALEKGFDDGALLSTYRDDAWPYVFTHTLARTGSAPPLRIGTLTSDGAFEPVAPDHPVQALLDAPNPTQGGREFRYLLLTYRALVGHAPIEIVRPKRAGARLIPANRAGFELWTVNPTWWRIVANPDGTIKGYMWVRESGSLTDVRWTSDTMTYLRRPNPNDRWYGQGWLTAVRQAAMAEEYAAIRDKKFEKNLGVPPGILTSEMPLGEPTATELQKRWEKAVGGYTNAGRIAVLGSKTTYQAIQMTARDAQWAEQRQWRVHEMAAASGVPMVLALGMKDATFANAAEATDYLWQETLQPDLDMTAEEITHKLLPLLTSEPLVARFDYSVVAALNENQLELLDRAVKMVQAGSFRRNEIRKVSGFDPLDETAGGDDLIMPVDAAAVSAEASPSREERQAVADRIAAATEAAQNAPPRPAIAARAEKAAASDREAVLASIREAYRRDLASFFRAQREVIRGEVSPTKALPGDEAETLIDRVVAALRASRFADRLRRISEGPIGTSVTLGAASAARALSIAVSFAIPSSEAALARVTGHLERLGVGIQNATVDDVKAVLEQALREGLDRDAMNAQLDTLFGGYEEWRLDRIARTETSAAYNLGAIGQYREAGVALVRVFDGDQDEGCAQANGALWTLEQAEADPLEHPNAVMAGTRLEILGAIEIGYRANWSGPLVRMTTANGTNLAIGPNHPVLTSRGWLAAKLIRKGDQVVRRTDEAFTSTDVYLHQPVARVEHIFDALSTMGTHARITAAPTYFHGDGNFCEGEVEIVRPECPLLVDAVTPIPEQVGKVLLVGAGSQSAVLTSDGPSVTDGETVHLAPTSLVSLRDAGWVIRRLAGRDAALGEPLSDGAVADAEFVAEFERRTTIAVTLDEVIDIGRAEFTGHAFDLQTTSGAYFADDILVHNCTRTWAPETEEAPS